MAQNFIQPGNVMDYLNSADADPILSGEVVALPDRVGVAITAIGAGDVGSVQMTGVFAIPKKSGESLTQGAMAYWETTGATATAGDVKAGLVWVEAFAADATVAVKLVG